MPTVIPPGFAEIAIQMRAQGDPTPWFNVSGYDVSEFGGSMELMALRAITAFKEWLPELPSMVTLIGADVTLGQDGGPPSKQFVGVVGNSAGAKSQAMLPQNCALLVKKNTVLGGRRNRGRAFIPSVLQDDWVDNVGVITNSARNELQGQADAWLNVLTSPTLDGTTMPMVILHGSEGAPLTEDPTPVTSLTVDPLISTQRRRLR